jgi:hypothetical protein
MSQHFDSETAGTIGRAAAQECAAIAADLERLKNLISDAGDRLLASFDEVGGIVPGLARDEPQRLRLTGAIGAAVTALQFQDIATQITAHAQRRLGALHDQLRASAGGLGVCLLATDAHPVGQAEMSAGSIDLF